MKNPIKNKLICAILAIAIFVPTVVAIVSYKTSDSTTVVSGDLASSLSVSDLNGKEYTFSKANGEDDLKMIDMFQKMIDNSTEVTSLPDVLMQAKYYKIVFSVDKLESAYQFYFGTTENYYTDSEGKAFSVPVEYTTEFLTTDCAQSIYTASVTPVLTLSTEYSVAPITSGENKSSWMYKNSTGSFVASALEDVTEKQTYDLDGALSMKFNNEPDSFTIRITDVSGNELFNDNYIAIGSLTLTPGITVNVTGTAKWYEDETRDYFGTLYYDFSAKVAAPAEFYPGVSYVSQGGMISVTAYNVKEPSKIGFTSEPAIGFVPTWHTENGAVRTLIAFSPDLLSGTYTLTFSYAGTTQNVAIEVKQSAFNTRTYTVDEDVFNKSYTDSAKAAYNDLVNSLSAASSDNRLWLGSFLSAPLNPTANISAGFGHMFNIEQANESIRHNGVNYKADTSTAVLAANSGKVVFAGENDYAGKLVVIDHGWGLLTWYAHLSEITVKEGDTIQKSDKLGMCGSTGFANQDGVEVTMTLYGQAVNPYSTWDDNDDYTDANLEMGIPMYEKK